MLYLDKKTLSILKYIKRQKKKGASWGELQKKFGTNNANFTLLMLLDQDLYILTQDKDGKWLNFNEFDGVLDQNFRSFSTPKANQMIERECFDFWKWIIPTFISVLALVVSALS